MYRHIDRRIIAESIKQKQLTSVLFRLLLALDPFPLSECCEKDCMDGGKKKHKVHTSVTYVKSKVRCNICKHLLLYRLLGEISEQPFHE